MLILVVLVSVSFGYNCEILRNAVSFDYLLKPSDRILLKCSSHQQAISLSVFGCKFTPRERYFFAYDVQSENSASYLVTAEIVYFQE